MMINRAENVLKGQHNLAQGNARSLKKGIKIVRAIMVIKEKFIFRTKKVVSILTGMMECYSVRMEAFSLIIILYGRVSLCYFYPGRCPELSYFGPSDRRIYLNIKCN
jgi:hypothetical protein